MTASLVTRVDNSAVFVRRVSAALRGVGRYSGRENPLSLTDTVSERFGNSLILQTGHQALFVEKTGRFPNFDLVENHCFRK